MNHDELVTEQTMLIGTMLSWMAYAFTCMTFVLCLQALSRVPKSPSRSIFISYASLLFGFISAYMALNTANKVRAFTTYRDYPGGPSGWVTTRKYDILCVSANVCVTCSITLSDGFVLYRAVKIYTTRQWITFLPCLLYVASLVTGGMYIAQGVDPSTRAWSTVPLTVPYFICASICNLATVFVIAARLLWLRHLVKKVVGEEHEEHSELYKSAFTIFIESAALYAVFSIVFIVSYATRSPVARLVVSALANVRGIASYLIILRLVRRTIVSETSCNVGGVTLSHCITWPTVARTVESGVVQRSVIGGSS